MRTTGSQAIRPIALATYPRLRPVGGSGPEPLQHIRLERSILREGLRFRGVVLAGLLLSYIWRFHDLAPVLTPLRLAALFTVLSWALLLFTPRVHVLRRALSLPYILFFLLWSAWMAVGIPFALDSSVASTQVWEVHLKTITMVFFLLTSLTSVRWLGFMIVVHLFGAGVLAFYYAKSGFPTLWTPVPMYDRNDLGLHFVMVIPLAFFAALTARAKWMKVAAWTLAALLGTSIVLSQSRGAFLGLAALTLFLLFRLQGVKRWMKVAPPVLLALGLLIAPPEVRDRLSSLGSLEDDYNLNSEVGRKAVWTRGLTYLAGHPIIGLGSNNFWVAEGTLAPQARAGTPGWKRSVAHNSFLSIAVETGLVGLILYLSMLTTALVGLFRLRRRLLAASGGGGSGNTLLPLLDCLAASLIGFMLTGFFISQEYSAITYLTLALVAGVEMNLISPQLRGAGGMVSTRQRPSHRRSPAIQISR